MSREESARHAAESLLSGSYGSHRSTYIPQQQQQPPQQQQPIRPEYGSMGSYQDNPYNYDPMYPRLAPPGPGNIQSMIFIFT
jgi:hypothetical protein